MGEKSVLTVGDLAKATDTKVETVRWYEKVGILPAPARTAGNYRAYGPEHLARLSFVRRGRDLGFTLDEVRALLELADQRDRDCGEVDAIIEAFYRGHREGDVATAGDSIVAYETWRVTGDAKILEDIEAYNADDCRSTAALRDWLISIRPADIRILQTLFGTRGNPDQR